VKWVDITNEEVKHVAIEERVGDSIKYKLINHATLLIQHKNVNIITDPVYVKRASPFPNLGGPKRYRNPSIPYEKLPPIDIVLISHDHYDHLDLLTLKRISDDHNPIIYVGLGLKAYLSRFGIQNLVEMDWEDAVDVLGLKLTFLYARHWSNRGFSPYKTLWGSYMIQSEEKTIYFAGDSAMDRHFEEINQAFPNIDLAFIPIGAYVPRSFMQLVHMPPEDAILAHKALNPKLSVAIHWGTFQLTGEGMYDPIDELQAIADQESITNFIYDRHHDQYDSVG
jgi:L-ascorbate metabolism protein UlaG (beta-lactamase superfamily)